jgi:hypothetical protein
MSRFLRKAGGTVRDRRWSAHDNECDLTLCQLTQQRVECGHDPVCRRLAASPPQLLGKAHESHRFPEALFHAQLQIFTDERAIDVFLDASTTRSRSLEALPLMMVLYGEHGQSAPRFSRRLPERCIEKFNASTETINLPNGRSDRHV